MTPEQVSKIYERLEGLSIDLPTDPSDLDPDYLREKISLCRNYLNEVGHYWQDALIRESRLATELGAEEAAFEVRSNELLSSDPSVAAGPSIADRQATIHTILRAERQRIASLKAELLQLSHVMKVIRFRKGELDNTMGTLRLQRSLLRDQIRTGSFYGDESEQSRGRPMDPVDGLDAEQLEALIISSEQEVEEEHAKASATVSVGRVRSAGKQKKSITSEGIPTEKAAAAPAAPVDDEDRALQQFLAEPDDDEIESILAGL